MRYEGENEQKGVPHLYFIIPHIYLIKRFGQTAHHKFCIINRKEKENERLYISKKILKTKKTTERKLIINKNIHIIMQQF